MRRATAIEFGWWRRNNSAIASLSPFRESAISSNSGFSCIIGIGMIFALQSAFHTGANRKSGENHRIFAVAAGSERQIVVVCRWQRQRRKQVSSFPPCKFALSDWIRDCTLCSESENEEHVCREDWKALVPADAPLTDVADSQRLPVQDMPAPLPIAMGRPGRQHSLTTGGTCRSRSGWTGVQCTVPSMRPVTVPAT